MKYYLHDTNSFQDEKITELFIHFGYEGIGLFYTLLEKIGMQEKPVKTSVLKSQLKVGKKLEKCWLFMETIGLISSNNGETFNERILSYSQTYQIKKEKNRERISQWRENQSDEKNVTRYESVSNTPKVNRSKVNRSKDISDDTPTSFTNFWNIYDKKVGSREKLKNKWEQLQEEERLKAIEFIPKYKTAQPDKFFRKNPETFLKNKSWNDELITAKVKNNENQISNVIPIRATAGKL